MTELSKEQKAALVMQLKRRTQRADALDHTIPRRQNRIDAPLSFAQQRLWFLQQLDPGSPAYNLPLYYRLNGRLHIEALERGLNEIIRRHEILRTVFGEKNGAAVQSVLPSLRVKLPLIDVSDLSKPESAHEIDRLIESEAARPFTLAEGPLLRAMLVKESAEAHGLFLVIHHIVTDGWSMDVFLAELLDLYEAFAVNAPSPLVELPLQYSDFAAWQRESLTGETLQQQLAYWKQQLTGELPVLELPMDHPRPLRMTYAGADEWFDATQNLTEKLNDVGRREGATLFMTLLAAFLTLLHRYSSQDDILLGTAIAGRNHADVEKLIGFFINTLVLRTDLSGDPSFRELLRRVREVSLGAYEHQDMPFEKLVEELQPERDASRPPFFQVMFNLQAAPPEASDRRTLAVTPVDIGNHTRFDLEFHLWVVPEGLAGPLLYNTDLFERTTIARMLAHFQTLLEGIVANPEARLSELPLLTKEERVQLQEWSRNETEYEREASVHELVERQAARQPGALAVVFGDQRLTYGELNERANQLAHHLRQQGVGPEVRVALLLAPSVELIVAMLATLKAGGAYVPLDGEYPQQRLRFMLDDAEVALVLTTRDQPVVAANRQVVYLDEPPEWMCTRENLSLQTSADNLAYVMYTSGSTGQPKGVEVTHRAINRLVRNTNYVEIESSDRMAQVSNVAFDAATFEVWGALSNGATLVGLAKETVLSPSEFKREIAEQRIGVMFLTATLFNQIAQSEPDAFAPMRYVLFGGEASDAQSVRRVLEQGKPAHLLNAYGPTENTTFTTSYEVDEVSPRARTLPIGRPLANTEVWVLDQHGRMAPVGVVGELYTGGDGLARGYLKRPELTAEKFVPHPFSAEPGARLYRTGDLVRFRSDGNIEFLGRRDQQVKLRGFRIELEEIESVLRAHSAVRESLVVMRDKRLVAYVVAEEDASELVPELRSWVRERLPEYFVPAFFVVLDKVPLTPNGKVDRRALPAPDFAPPAEETLIAPRTPEEKKIAEIWADVLDVKPVGVATNFFDLGGHSLLATRVITRIREACGVNVPLRILFESPTVAAIAAHVAEARHDSELSRISEMVEKLAHLSEEETRTLLEQAAGSQT